MGARCLVGQAQLAAAASWGASCMRAKAPALGSRGRRTPGRRDMPQTPPRTPLPARTLGVLGARLVAWRQQLAGQRSGC